MKHIFRRRNLMVGSSVIVALGLVAFVAISAFLSPRVRDPFDRDTKGLPEARGAQVVELKDGDTFELRASMVRKRIGEETVKMLAYNGSIPGPTLKVHQGDKVTVKVTNESDLAATVHWQIDGHQQSARQIAIG